MIKNNKDYSDIFVSADIKKKKGGSLGAVLKLIQDLAEFEEKIEEAASAQEMLENKEKINAFISQIDEMYSTLLQMAKLSINAIRQSRGQAIDEEEFVEEEIVEKSPVIDTKRKSSIVTPVIPKL